MLKHLLENIAMIIIFIAIKAAPIGTKLEGYWMVGLLIGVLIFTYSHEIGTKLVSIIPESIMKESSIKKFISNVSVIFIFISLRASPIGDSIDKNWIYWLVGGILLFILSKKAKNGI